MAIVLNIKPEGEMQRVISCVNFLIIYFTVGFFRGDPCMQLEIDWDLNRVHMWGWLYIAIAMAMWSSITKNVEFSVADSQGLFMLNLFICVTWNRSC